MPITTNKKLSELSPEVLKAALGGSRQAFQQHGKEIFNQQAIDEAAQIASSIPSAIRSGAQSVAQGVMMAPAELASGAVRLASPELADKMEAGYGRFNAAMRQGSNQFYGQGPNDGISKDAAKTLYGIGNTLPLGAGVGTSASFLGRLGQAAGLGAVGGIQAAGEGDDRSQLLAKAGLGAGVGIAAQGTMEGGLLALQKGIGAVKHVTGWDKTAEAVNLKKATKAAEEIHKAMKQDVNGIYKDLGIPKTKLSTEDITKQAEFLAKFKNELGDEMSMAYTISDATKAPQQVISKFKEVHKQVIKDAEKLMRTDLSSANKTALENKGSMLYYDQLRKVLAKDNPDFSAEAINVMKESVPEYAAAIKAYDKYNAFGKDISANFFDQLKSNKYEQILPDIESIMQTQNGKDVLHQMFTSGMRRTLVKNSNLTPLEQLTKTVGSDPLQQTQVIDYLQRIGKSESANKIQALASFVNATKLASSQPNSAIAKVVGMKSSELDPTKMADAIGNLLNSKSKFSAELTKLMQEQVPSATRTEKFFNLLRRAGKHGKLAADLGEKVLEGGETIGVSAYKAAPSMLPRTVFDTQSNNNKGGY